MHTKSALFGAIFSFLLIISYGCGSNQPDNTDIDSDVTGGNSDGDSSTSGASSGDSGSGSESGASDSGTGTTGITAPNIDTLPGRSDLPTSSGGSGTGSGASDITDPTGLPTDFSSLPKIETPVYKTMALWRGAYFDYEDNDESCEHHQVYSIGQSFENSTDEDDQSTLKVSTVLQNISDSPRSEKYRYKSYYTTVTYNTKYLRFFQGKSEISKNIYDEAEITIPAGDLEETLEGFNGKKVTALLNGAWANYKSGKNNSVTELRAVINYVAHDVDGNIVLGVQGDLDHIGDEEDKFTFYYTLVFYDADYVTEPSIREEKTLESSDCESFECTTSYMIDFDAHEIQNAAFTGLTSWGFIDTKFDVEFEKLGAYASLEQNDTGGKISYRGEVYHPDCGLFSKEEQVTPMSLTKAKTFVCKNGTVCRSEEHSLGWVSVNPSDHTAISIQSIELEDVEAVKFEE